MVIYVYTQLLLALFTSPVPVQTEPDDVLRLSRVLVAEGGPRLGPDHAAILHVFERRRATVPRLSRLRLVDVAERYAVGFNGRSTSPRAALMRSLDYSDIPDGIVALARSWLDGRRPRNPCPGAAHFAAPSLPSPLTRVQCTKTTRNAYYALPSRAKK